MKPNTWQSKLDSILDDILIYLENKNWALSDVYFKHVMYPIEKKILHR